jgi:hypothetical protein
MRLAELGEKVGMDYGSVQVAVRRLGEKLKRDGRLAKVVSRLEQRLGVDV